MIGHIIDFLQTGIWEVKTKELSRLKTLAVRSLRTLLLAVHGFIDHKSATYASILTYYSVLNIVPLIAVVFAIAKGFGLDKLVENQILQIAENANWQFDVTEQLLGFARTFLEQAKGGVIAGVGVVLLFWTVISILGKIEESFNLIWGTKTHRTILRKFTDYMAILIIAPVLFAISSSLTVLVTGEVTLIVHKIKLLGVFGPFIVFLLKFLPYVSLWVLLTILYVIMPNSKVPLRSAITGSIVAGTLVQIVQWLYITFQIGVASHGVIYGSLAAIPLLFGWLQTSWMIVLFGLEIARANEHRETYGLKPAYSDISISSKKVLMLSIFSLLVKRFSAGEKAFSAFEISSTLKIPLVVVQELLENMIRAHLVVEVTDENNSGGFQPARSIEGLTIEDILHAREAPGTVLSDQQSVDIAEMSDLLKRLHDAIENLPENIKINKL